MITEFDDLTITVDGTDIVIDLTEHGGGTIRLWDVDIDSLDADDFIFAEADSGAGSDNSGENLQSASATVSSTLATFSTSFENGEFVYGTGENDRFLGTEGVDRYDGAGGDDTILGGDSNDTVRGGEGQDSIHGDGGNDVLYGGVGNDWLV